MGRAQQKRTNELNESVRQQSSARYTDYGRDQNAIGQEYRNQQRPTYDRAMGVYDTLAQGYPAGSGGSGSGSGGGGGGNSYIRDFNPANVADAKAGYDEFAKTGGYSDQDQAMFRARGNATLPSFYSNLKNNMATQRNRQGGYGAGFDAADAAMAREAAQATYEGQLGTENTLQNNIREGRRFGIGGQADLGKFKSNFELQRDTSQGSLNESAANRAQRNTEFTADEDFRRRQEAARGYSGLYGDSGALEGGARQRQLGGLTAEDQMQAGAINRQYEYNRPWGGALANSLIGGLTGASGGWLGNIGKAALGGLGKGSGGDSNAGYYDDATGQYVNPSNPYPFYPNPDPNRE